ncbi:urease accessory protein D isoform X2 [Arachis duranensis]|uniref:Urease accessory protein D isoform X2 n=1 Tax=Arachis duranensis TaxID=130453 RepID=A0A9C6TQL7_ARADU|nr:urease accessory protein D isoform X2 [Arachis duranensis]
MGNEQEDKEMEMGSIVVEKVGGRSSVVHCFSRYPVKFIIPKKVGSSRTDVVWVYALNYGGGIVSGDQILCKFSVGDCCTMVLTTQGSTKARVGSNALLAIIPDPVTCFSTARYYQKQVFNVSSNSNLVIVDWITSGRHESGEKWDFDLYRSINNIFLEDGEPLFLDTMSLEKEKIGCIHELVQDYQVIAMILLLGPKLQFVQNLVQDKVKGIMSEQLQHPSGALSHKRNEAGYFISKPSLMASCSVFGTKNQFGHIWLESFYKSIETRGRKTRNANFMISAHSNLYKPAMLYGTECWAAKGEHKNKLSVTEIKMLRWMSGHMRLDRIRNDDIRERVGVASILEKIVESRLRWFGHVRRRPTEHPVRKVDEMEDGQGVKGRGRPKKTIHEVVKRDPHVNGLSIDTINDRAQ